MKLNRKRSLAVGALIVAVTVLSGCVGFGSGGGGGGEAGSKELTFTTWAGDSEAVAFKALIKQFEAENDGVTVKLNVVPYA